MSKTVSDLRAILFDAIEGVKEGNLDLDNAKTINELSRTIVDSARAENDHAKITGGQGGEFLDTSHKLLSGQSGIERTATGTKTVTALPGGATITQHKMRG